MNKCYLISYDLRKARDYQGLYNALKTYSICGKVLESVWVIVTSQSAEQVRDYLAKYMDSDDGLLVLRSGREAAWLKVLCSNQWLKETLEKF